MAAATEGRSPSYTPAEFAEVREWRHALQNSFLHKKPPFNGEEMDALYHKLERYENIPADLVAYSKIHKVMRHIIGLKSEDIPRDDEFHFLERAKSLERRWQSIRAAKAALDSAPQENAQVSVSQAVSTPVLDEKRHQKRSIDNDEDQKEAQKVRKWRHDLQYYFLTDRVKSLSQKDLTTIHKIFSTMESYERMTSASLLYAKFPKVLRCILALETIPGDEEFNFRERSHNLLTVWMSLVTDNSRSNLAVEKKDAENAPPAEDPGVELQTNAEESGIEGREEEPRTSAIPAEIAVTEDEDENDKADSAVLEKGVVASEDDQTSTETNAVAPEDTSEVPAPAKKAADAVVASQLAEAMVSLDLDSPPDKAPEERKPKVEYPPKKESEVLEEDPWVLIEFGVTMTEAGA